jgi:hypothetical protein
MKKENHSTEEKNFRLIFTIDLVTNRFFFVKSKFKR